jgi:rhamnogalacturonan endolyase
MLIQPAINYRLHDLLADAESFADPTWNSAFYDEVAPYVRCTDS